MKRENGFDVVPPIETWSDTGPTFSLGGSNQKMNYSQSFRVGYNFLIQRKPGLFIRSSKPHSIKPFLNASIRHVYFEVKIPRFMHLGLHFFLMTSNKYQYGAFPAMTAFDF
jgi:hypothetical protein